MKKLITVILILAVFLPVVAIADDIVGTWYTYTGVISEPGQMEGAYYEISIFHFSEDGNVFTSSYYVDKNGITTCKDYKVIALWTKDNDKYYINVGLSGAIELYFDNNDLYFPVEGYSIRMHRMIPLNYALDVRK